VFERGYRQRLEADLVKWVADGVISGDAAKSIRTARFAEEATSRLPAIFAMLQRDTTRRSVSLHPADRIPRTPPGDGNGRAAHAPAGSHPVTEEAS